MYQAFVVADSISEAGVRLITLQLRYWRAIHAEFMTHRVFSRNASSSRAIPVAKMLKQVREEPFGPLHWGANQAGMQAHAELEGKALQVAKDLWHTAAREAAQTAELMSTLGLHKQVANRILEPFLPISVIVTATEWDNFFQLRDHKDAQPEIRHLTQLMKEAIDSSSPMAIRDGEWHLPYVYDMEIREYGIEVARKLSVARCARVSYLTHDGQQPSVEKDIELHDKLVVAEPLHASPAEHQATPYALKFGNGRDFIRNFRGWQQYRVLLEAN